MVRRSSAIVRVVGGLLAATAFAAGCGPSSPSDGAEAKGRAVKPSARTASGGVVPPADADPETKKLYLVENAVAECMEKLGFLYRPYVSVPTDDELGAAIDGRDYDLAKKYRQKYGYGLYSAAVYPDDPQRLEGADTGADPNGAYVQALSPSQRAAFYKALNGKASPQLGEQSKGGGGCAYTAHQKVYGSATEQKRQWETQQERNRRSGQALNGDEELIRLAQDYATCLRGKGLTAGNTQPTDIGDTVKFGISAAMPPAGVSQMDRDAAAKALSREVEAALADLECGKEFRAAYFPKLKAHPYTGGQG